MSSSRVPRLLFAFSLTGLLATAASAQERFPIVMEPLQSGNQPPLSMEGGARNLSSLIRVTPRVADRLLQHLQGSSSLSLPTRVAGGALIDLPVVLSATWLQHEAFGHAVHCRDFDSCAYSVAFPFPFGFAPDHNQTFLDVAAVVPFMGLHFLAAGRQAEQVLHDELLRQGLQGGSWTRTSALSFGVQAWQLGWELIRPSARSDRARYYALLPQARPDLTWTNYTRNIQGLVQLFRAADPVMWISLYQYFVQWLIFGETPSLPDLLPGPLTGFIRPRAVETPWGVEMGADAMLMWNETRWEAGFLLPTKTGVSGYTAWLDTPLPSPSSKLEFRLRPAVWLQDDHFGLGLEVDTTWWAMPNLGLHARLGAKTPGLWNGRTTAYLGAYGQLGVELR